MLYAVEFPPSCEVSTSRVQSPDVPLKNYMLRVDVLRNPAHIHLTGDFPALAAKAQILRPYW